ncbi:MULTISPECIES: hypothetical protein [Streptomyces]|uniref:Uncharacterized protein n=1 Tax=Streptomyces lonegramiae TaxID=3075524 RepID=A0ABU2XB42_9ACTN|nr:hypothetical protein [Streptomyces sp. DSM 41529]MDT0543142.1 hypothetical protein [Streptomyces sp. DSM 41529]
MRRRNLRFVGILALAHIAAAGFMVALLYQVGSVTFGHFGYDVRMVMCGAAAVAGIVLDARAIKRGTFTVGLRRQTAKTLSDDSGDTPGWVTPLLWGLDTGLVWTTFRMSSASWVLLVSALLTVVPQWGGLVYGVFFGIPLIIATMIGDPAGIGRPRKYSLTRLTQGAGIIVLMLLPLGLIGSLHGGA